MFKLLYLIFFVVHASKSYSWAQNFIIGVITPDDKVLDKVLT